MKHNDNEGTLYEMIPRKVNNDKEVIFYTETFSSNEQYKKILVKENEKHYCMILDKKELIDEYGKFKGIKYKVLWRDKVIYIRDWHLGNQVENI